MRLHQNGQVLPIDTPEAACVSCYRLCSQSYSSLTPSDQDEQLNQETSPNDSSNDIFTPATVSDIAPFSLSLCLRPSKESPSLQTTLGHDVPPELFRTILSYIWDVVWRPGVRVNANDYRGLGHLALVSRYWAKQVRHLILEELVIHDALGVERMKSVLKPPNEFGFEHPATLIRDLQLVCSGPNHPWIHNVARIVSETPDLARNIILSLDLVDYRQYPRGTSNCPRTIFYYLPRPLPSSFWHFYQLTLKDVRFDQASDFFHLVSQLSNLRRLQLINVSWTSSSPHHSPDSFPACLESIAVFEDDRYGHGGRGILPWVLASASNFTKSRKTQASNSMLLPWILRPYYNASTYVPFSHPSQYDHILNMLDVFSHHDVSCILKSPKTIQWDIGRTKSGGYVKPDAARGFSLDC